MSVFATAAALLDGAVADVFGEAFRLLPRRRAGENAPGVTDPDRAEVDFVGSWFEGPKPVALVDALDTRSDSRLTVQSTVRSILVAAGVFAVRPKSGDLVRRVGGGTVFTIANIGDNGTGGLVLFVNPARSALP